MKAKEIVVSILVLLLVVGLGYLWFSPSAMRQAPQLSVTTLDGRTLDLSDLRGHPVLVTFWATTCPGCIKEMPHLVEFYREYAPKGLEIVGIAVEYDPPNQVREMVQRRGIPYPVAMDTTGAAARAFGDVRLTPTHFLIDPEGRIAKQKLGELDMNELRERVQKMLGTV